MSPEQTAFLTFVRTGAFGVIQPEMDVDTVNALLPGCDHRPNPPYERLIGEHVEISFEDRRMTQVRVRFIVYETDPWTTEVAPWFDWLRTVNMQDIEQCFQEQRLGYRCIRFTDDSYAIELLHIPIRLSYDEEWQIDKVFRLYEELDPWHPNLFVDIKTFTPEDAEDNRET